MNLIRPRIADAYRHVSKLAVLKRGFESHEAMETSTRVTSVLLDAADRPISFGPQARQWLAHFFPENSRNPSRLPTAVTDWLRRLPRTKPARLSAKFAPVMLERERDGQRLQLRMISAPSPSECILILSLETSEMTARSALARKLSNRQIEVLLQVEQGKTNNEVAATLGISPLTVRLHLERIFDKLKVSNRTGAVTAFRRITGGEFQNSQAAEIIRCDGAVQAGSEYLASNQSASARRFR